MFVDPKLEEHFINNENDVSERGDEDLSPKKQKSL